MGSVGWAWPGTRPNSYVGFRTSSLTANVGISLGEIGRAPWCAKKRYFGGFGNRGSPASPRWRTCPTLLGALL
eukprot:6564389-Pyramimonas_sp.AAC.2